MLTALKMMSSMNNTSMDLSHVHLPAFHCLLSNDNIAIGHQLGQAKTRDGQIERTDIRANYFH